MSDSCCCATNPPGTRCYSCQLGVHLNCADTGARPRPRESELAPRAEPSDFLYSASDVPERWTKGFDRSRTWYLSGPMTGYEKFNFPAFERAAYALRQVTTVVSAHEVNHGEHTGTGTLPHAEYLRGDLAELLECDGIIMLKGWPKSKGARLELEVAISLDFPVWFYDEFRLIEL